MGRVVAILCGLVLVGCRDDPGTAIFLKDDPAGTTTTDSGDALAWPEDELEVDACIEEEPDPQIGPWADAFPVPGTTFDQGCTQPEVRPCYPNEFPAHTVTVGDVQAMATEVSQELWLAVMGDNPSGHKSCGCNCPVESITWFEAVAFANALSEAQGHTLAYTIDGTEVSWDRDSLGWRLPTESEWERMAKGDDDHIVAAGGDVATAAWYRENAPDGPRPVGQKEPTVHGIHDLNGNVWEWVWDWSSDYTTDSADNPSGPDTGSVRVLRGGSYVDDFRVVRTSVRRELPPDHLVESVGLRLVRGAVLEAP